MVLVPRAAASRSSERREERDRHRRPRAQIRRVADLVVEGQGSRVQRRHLHADLAADHRDLLAAARGERRDLEPSPDRCCRRRRCRWPARRSARPCSTACRSCRCAQPARGRWRARSSRASAPTVSPGVVTGVVTTGVGTHGVARCRVDRSRVDRRRVARCGVARCRRDRPARRRRRRCASCFRHPVPRRVLGRDGIHVDRRDRHGVGRQDRRSAGRGPGRRRSRTAERRLPAARCRRHRSAAGAPTTTDVGVLGASRCRGGRRRERRRGDRGRGHGRRRARRDAADRDQTRQARSATRADP